MKEAIQKTEIKKFNHYGRIYGILLVAVVLSLVPLMKWLGNYCFIPWGVLIAATLYFAFKVEKVKRDNKIFTYKEVVAFTEGRRLDEMETQREIGKRHYQGVLYVLISAAAGFAASYLMMNIFF